MTVTAQADSGTVVEVSTVTLGDELASDHAAGATTLTVKDAVDFADDGGWLTIGTERIYYDSAADDETNDVGVLTLSTPTAGAYAEGERVVLDPPSFEKFAQVMVGNFGEAQQARIGYSLWDRLADGIRADGEGEVVTLDLVGSEFVVADVIGSAPLVDGSYLDPSVPLLPELAASGPPGDPGLTWQGSWNAATAYVVNDAVAYNGASYRRKVAGTTATDPATDTANWELIADRGAQGPAGLNWTGAWDAATAYAVSDAVTYNGSSYRRTVAGTTAGSPDTDTANWEGVALIDYLLAGTIDNESGTFRLGVGTVKKIEATGPLGDLLGLAAIDPTNPDVPNGFYSFGAPAVLGEQGPVRVHFPVDGKPNIVSGTSEFDSLTAREFTLDGTQTVSPGKQIVLGGQVQAPKNPPAVNADWHTVAHTGGHVGSTGWDYAGLTLGHDGNWRTVANKSGATSVVEAFNPTTGALVSSTALDSAYTYTGGIAYLAHNGGRYYLLAKRISTGDWYIECRDTSLALVGTRTLLGAIPDGGAIGVDHANSKVLVAYPSGLQVFIQTRSFNASGVATYEGVVNTPGSYEYAFDLGYIARVTTESGDRYVFRKTASDGGASFQVFTTAATPVHQTSEEWPSAQSSACRGGWWDGTRFWSLDNNGRRRRYETGRCMWTSGSAVREIQYDWADTVGTTHFTTPSPKASLTLPKRARISVTVQTIPLGAGGVDDPNAARVFVGVGTGVANGSMNLEKTIIAPASSWSLDSSVAQESATTHPATSNGFGTGAAASLAGTAGTFVDATGAIPAGPFRDSVDARVTAVGLQQTVSAVLNATGSFAGTVQFIKTGRMVTVVADVSRATGFNASFADIGVTVPAAFRPAANVIMPSAVLFNGTASYSYRIDAAGTVSLRQSAAFAASMTLAASYIVP